MAECGFALILCALRKIPHWHHRLVERAFDWNYPCGQFCDDPDFVNGELATKTVGVVGLGQIGARIAHWCHLFGAEVAACDPYAPAERFESVGARSVDIDALVQSVDILVIAVPPTPSARKLVHAQRVAALPKGAIVMSITRTAALDTEALRERVLRNELLWASDVFDVEPLPDNDPILGRDNVVHIPHIAGRTRDANHRVAEVIASDFIRVLAGESPRAALSPAAVAVRTGSPLQP